MDQVMNFLRDGESKLPPGFRFQPTDEEIVYGYLARKVFNHLLPTSVILEIDIFGFDPCELPGDSDQDKYFFSNMQTNHLNVNGIIRATCGGYWKITSSDKQIICSKSAPIVGIKKTMVFYQCSHSNYSRTDWTMHLYNIVFLANRASNMQQKENPKGSLKQVGNWVLCHVFLKKRCTKAEVANRLRAYGDCMVGGIIIDDTDSSSYDSSYSCSDSDSSSVITEVSSSPSGETIQ